MQVLSLIQTISTHVTAANVEHFIELVEKLIVLAETMDSTNSNQSQSGSAASS